MTHSVLRHFERHLDMTLRTKVIYLARSKLSSVSLGQICDWTIPLNLRDDIDEIRRVRQIPVV